MSARQASPYGGLACKWLALAERRKAHLLAILESGRWRRHVTDGQLEDQLCELEFICYRFAEIAGAEIAGTARAAAPGSDASQPFLLRLLAGNTRARPA